VRGSLDRLGGRGHGAPRCILRGGGKAEDKQRNRGGRRRDSVVRDRLRSLREAAGLTQEELASRAGLSSHAVSALERGTRRRPHPHTVRSLSDALELPEDERAALLAAVPERGGIVSLVPPADPGLPAPPTPLVGRERDVTRSIHAGS
jgi:transcriptional regulator with XRE-family HTH domain